MVVKKFMRKILADANNGEKNMKVYTNFFGTKSESHLQDMERLGLVHHMKVGFKGNEFYVVKYNQKELQYMGIDIEKEKFYNALQYELEKRQDRINEIKASLLIPDSKKEALLQDKEDNTLLGYHIYFSENENVYREYYLIKTKDGEKFVLTNNGAVCYYDMFCKVMKDIYGENAESIIKRNNNSHLLALCRLC